MCLIIFLGAAGFVFYQGWTQFKVPRDSVGIVVSKTGGIAFDKPVTHDKFSWNWEFLLPTNAELKIFSVKPCSFDKTAKGILPSGEEYSRVYDGQASFAYELGFSLVLKAGTEQIAFLLKNQEIRTQEDLEKVLDRNAGILANLAAQKVLDGAISKRVTSFDGAQDTAKKAAGGAAASLKDKFTLEDMVLTKYSVPDIDLYNSAAASYADFIKSLKENAALAAQREAEESSRFKMTIQKMETLGETLKKYPELSDILKNSDNINKTLETIDSLR